MKNKPPTDHNMPSRYDVVIGLEVHVQMKTNSKMFCGCDNDSEGAKPNTNVCQICLGHPGVLPRLNKQAVAWGVKTAIAINCDIPARSKFDRKNYFYPDLPKGYQISQFDEPIGQNGHVLVQMGEKRFRVGINRLHLEEDAGKLTHPGGAQYSLVDFNRGGTPLMEIVTEPDIKTPQHAKAYLEELKHIVQYLGVSDADMEKGQLRCDANISLRPHGDPKLYPKTEVKNLNSFRAVERALAYEIERQAEMWDNGEMPEHATRGWDEKKGETVQQRTKEDAADYRYFPEPDIPVLTFDKKQLDVWKKEIPVLPDAMRTRLQEEYGVSAADSAVIAGSRAVGDFFEHTLSEAREYVASAKGSALNAKEDKKVVKLVVAWITTELFRLMKDARAVMDDVQITPENMGELVAMIYRGDINSTAGQTILAEMFAHGKDPSQIADALDLKQDNDADAIEKVVDAVMAAHPDIVQQIKDGKENAIQFLVGMVMKETKGKANPAVAQELLRKKCGNKL